MMLFRPLRHQSKTNSGGTGIRTRDRFTPGQFSKLLRYRYDIPPSKSNKHKQEEGGILTHGNISVNCCFILFSRKRQDLHPQGFHPDAFKALSSTVFRSLPNSPTQQKSAGLFNLSALGFLCFKITIKNLQVYAERKNYFPKTMTSQKYWNYSFQSQSMCPCC